MNVEELFEILYQKLKEKFPHLNIEKSSLISKLILYPISFLYSEIFNLLNDFSSLENKQDFINFLYAKLYNIDYEIFSEITPGEIKLTVGEVKDITISRGTKVFSLSSSNNGIVISDIRLKKEEIENRIINNMDIIVYFAGNLRLNEEVIFESYEGDIISSIVVREYNNRKLRLNLNDNQNVLNIITQRPILFGTFSKEGIEMKLGGNVEIIDTLTTDNPFVIFDIEESERYYYVAPVEITDNKLKVFLNNTFNIKNFNLNDIFRII